MQLCNRSLNGFVGHGVMSTFNGASAHALRKDDEMPDLRKSHLLAIGQVITKDPIFIQVQRVEQPSKLLALRGEGRLLQVGGLSSIQHPLSYFRELFVLFLAFPY